MGGTFYITTAIDYTNGAPHIGHAYEKVLTDVITRYQRLKTGKIESAFFLTGVDQHGQKVQQSADKQGVAPQQFVDDITKKFLALWEKLDVRYDRWAATTDPLHKTCVQKILQKLRDEGKIYKDKQGGYYSVRQEQFLTDKERGPDGQFGPEWGEVEFREEENYYFKLAEHRDWLLRHIDTHENFVTPAFRRSELRNAVEKLTGDLCVSRPKSRLAWGIEFPFDPDYVCYVWFDALVNYISFAGYDPNSELGTRNSESEDWAADAANAGSTTSAFRVSTSEFSSLWPALHVIGKDILIPAHGIYWVIMLHALGFPDDQIPSFLVHGWWNISGAKMSKSTGNIIDPDALADKYGAEALRYYLMSDIATGKDADFSEERLIQRYNVDLANNLGNLLNRTLNMAQKYRDGRLKLSGREQTFPGQDGNPFPFGGTVEMFVQLYCDGMDGFATELPGTRKSTDPYLVHAALSKVSEIAMQCNGLVEIMAPWKLAKDPARTELLDAVLYTLAESLRIIAILISPVLPKAAHGIFDQLQWKLDEAGSDLRFNLSDTAWGGLPDGHVVGKPVPLFPRIEA